MSKNSVYLPNQMALVQPFQPEPGPVSMGFLSSRRPIPNPGVSITFQDTKQGKVLVIENTNTSVTKLSEKNSKT